MASSQAIADTESNDKICRVMCKLSALDDFFSVYSVQGNMALRVDAISGLSFILGDCADELREVIDEPAKIGL
ncbi:MAG: hypothetical protein FWB79_04005 [Treponema sp.]|nr:hypothetical protein [Treponema sp.]